MDINYIDEFIKCSQDPVYFANNYGYVFDMKKQQISKMQCFPYQEECLRTFNDNQNSIVLKSRQMGLSVISAMYVAWRLIFCFDERILVVADNGNGAVRFLNTVRQVLDKLPDWMLPDERLVNNTKQIAFSNGSWVKAVASSKQAGRGESLTCLILDEAAFIEHAQDIWMGAGLALSATQGKCLMISCVPKDTMVFTDKGIKTINDFVVEGNSGGYEIEKYNVFGKDKLREGNLFFNNGFHDTKIITTTNAQIEGTYTHKLWACKNGVYDWYKMGDLNEGDYISVQYGMEIWNNNDIIENFNPSKNNKITNPYTPEKITKELSYLIGLYIAEGSVYKKHNKNNEFIGGSVTITCGDDVSKAILDCGLKYSSHDNLHYSICSKNFIELLEHLGFDLSKKAKEKEIPSRLLEMSRENIIYMLRGIFDGDGFSRKDKGYIGITLSSKKLINQLRMVLLNFGVLTDYDECITPPTELVKVESLGYRLTANGEFSKVYYEKINFNFKRKQKNELVLEKYDLIRNSGNDIIPFSLDLIKKVVEESKLKNSFFKQHKIFVNGILNKTTEYKTKHISRGLFIKIYNLCKNLISLETKQEVEKILSSNLKWNKINKIELSQNETYDFSLPNNEEDFWAHSVIYNGVLGHQTPKGTGNLYHQTWVQASKKEGNFVSLKLHWSIHPFLSANLEYRKDSEGRELPWSPWYQGECDRLHHDRVKISQELDLSFEGSSAVVIENDIIEKYRRAIINEKPICYYDFKKEGDKFVTYETGFHIFKKPRPDGNYIIGADVGRGDSADYSTIQIIDADNLEQVAEYQGKIVPDAFAEMIYNVGMDYNKAYTAVECNSFGLATTLILKNQLKYPIDKMHVSKSAVKLFNRTNNYVVEKDTDVPGFQTTVKTRPMLISNLVKYMRDMEIKIFSNRLLTEFETFIYNGEKIEHAPGFHDDLIFAFAIALLMRETEFSSIFNNTQTTKLMLDLISYSKNDISNLDFNKGDKKSWEDDDDFNDDRWLYGPITG